MKTVILKWNPAFSSFKMEIFKKFADREYNRMDWSVWEWEKVEDGDLFYLIRVGQGNTGIVMRGKIISKPYEGEDWSGKGRPTHYVDLYVADVYDSDVMPYISVAQLENAIPEFEWGRGHSGMVLSEELAAKLEKLYDEFYEKYYDEFPWNVDPFGIAP